MGRSSRKEKQYRFHKSVVDGAEPVPPKRLAKIRQHLAWRTCETRSEKFEVFVAVSGRSYRCIKKLFIPEMDLGDTSRKHWMDKAYKRGALCEMCSQASTQRTVGPLMFMPLRHFLHGGANPNECNADRGKHISCLHYVACGGHCKLAELLLAFGADPDVKNFAWDTPLSIAVTRGHAELAKVLLTCGANANTLDRSGHSPLYYACVALDMSMVRLLLARGASTLLPAEASPVVDLCQGAKGPKGAKGSISAAGAQKLKAVVYPAWVNEKHALTARKATAAAAAKEAKVCEFLARRSAMSVEEKKAEHRAKKAMLKRLNEEVAARERVEEEAAEHDRAIASFVEAEGEKRRKHLIEVGTKVGEGAWHRRVSGEATKWEWDPGFADDVDGGAVDPKLLRAQEKNKQGNRQLISALRGQPAAANAAGKKGASKRRGWRRKRVAPDDAKVAGSRKSAAAGARGNSDDDSADAAAAPRWQSTADDERWQAARKALRVPTPPRGLYAPPPNSEMEAVVDAPGWAEVVRLQT